MKYKIGQNITKLNNEPVYCEKKPECRNYDVKILGIERDITCNPKSRNKWYILTLKCNRCLDSVFKAGYHDDEVEQKEKEKEKEKEVIINNVR